MGFIQETNETYYSGGDLGSYQFVELSSIINNFILMFTGEGKVIPKARRTEIQMHAKRAIQEFSYDIFRTSKSYEIELSPSLTMPLPQDYVNWIKVVRIDSQGTERELAPIRVTSNPSSILQDSNYDYLYDDNGDLLLAHESKTWERTKQGGTASDNADEIRLGLLTNGQRGQRFGLDPENANSNGGFYIDEAMGIMHFTGGAAGSIITLKYLSDGMGKDDEMVVHKFAEDAVYKYIVYSIINVTMGAQEYLVRRYKKNFVAAKRVAKLRLSNLKAGALTQIMRGKSKQIKH